MAVAMKKSLLSVTTAAARVMMTKASRPMYILKGTEMIERRALLRVKLSMVTTWGRRLLYPDQGPLRLYRLKAVPLSVISPILKMMLSFAP